tara:strand:+ start:228 stop:383 length:156 start_codon:yes stop_codon:yes gene_type:complete
MKIKLSKPIQLAGVSHKAGEIVEATDAVAVLLVDCGETEKPKAKKKTARGG